MARAIALPGGSGEPRSASASPFHSALNASEPLERTFQSDVSRPIDTRSQRILGGLWGSLVGDAPGVPVEFKNRDELQASPVTDMRGYGSHRQPPGTWSDDSSLLLCTVDSLVRHEFDTSTP